jgi:hypothetical protein
MKIKYIIAKFVMLLYLTYEMNVGYQELILAEYKSFY